MRFLVPVLLLATGTLAVAGSADDRCAATFSMLSDSAHRQGIDSAAFDRMARTARAHNGKTSPVLQDAARALSLTDLAGQVVSCHVRYEETQVAAL